MATESADSGQEKRKNEEKRALYARSSSQCSIPHFEKDLSTMAGLGRGYAVHFYASLQHVNAKHESLKPILSSTAFPMP